MRLVNRHRKNDMLHVSFFSEQREPAHVPVVNESVKEMRATAKQKETADGDKDFEN